MRNRQRASLSLYLFLFLAIGITWASIAGSISGLVTDSSGAVIAGTKVIATDTQTGVQTTVITDAKGF